MINIGHATTLSLLTNDLAGRTLGAHKQDLVLASGFLLNETHGFVEQWQGFFQIDDMNFVARTKDVFAHLGVPVTGLVAKVDASLQHVAHGYVLSHGDS